MSNVLEIRTTQENTLHVDSAKRTSNPERAKRNPKRPSFLSTFRRLEKKLQEKINSFYAILRTDDKGLLSILERGANPTPKCLFPFLNRSQLRAQIREISQKKARSIHALEIDKVLLKAAGDAILDRLQIDLDSGNNGLTKETFFFVENVQTDLVLKRKLHDILVKNM